jgi:polyisoprenoid-binding protein YceI
MLGLAGLIRRANYIMAKVYWKADPLCSLISLRARHLFISHVHLYVRRFRVLAETEGEDFGTLKLGLVADMTSVDSGNKMRDQYLMSPEFFDVGRFPEIKYTGEAASSGGRQLQGLLTVKETTRPLSLAVDFGGLVTTPEGQCQGGFTFNGKLSRKAFGLTWHMVTELGDEVQINADVLLVQRPKPADTLGEEELGA